MNTRSVSVPRPSTDAAREDWLRAGILAGFLGTFAMTIVLLAAYWLASTIGSADGGVIQRWSWALVNNPVAERTADGVVLAIGANLAMGLLLALVYARYAEPRLHGPSWWRGMQFTLVPWLLSLVVFLPLMGGGALGIDVGAGPLPIIGNLILHLAYGAVLGLSFAEASEDWLDETDVDRGNAAAAEQGAAVGLVAGLVPGLVVGWIIAPALGDLVGRSESAIGVAFIGAAIGLAIGSFAGMSRAERATQGPPVRH
jgi:hypothetical protein